MLFHTMEFVVFFAVVAIFSRLYDGGLRKWLLLFASYNFYMAWNPYFAALILSSTLIDYLCGIRIQTNTRLPRRRFWLILSLVSNLGLLAVFKYLGLFEDMINSFMSAFDIDTQVTLWQLTLPVGISFFTFQSMSHTIDVYRRHLDAERSLLNFSLYVAFFPQLVAGPIVRARDFLPQLHRESRPTATDLVEGLERVLVGLTKKLVVADNLATLVDSVFTAPGAMDTPFAWLGAICFSLQIYMDFSGYSDMAIGLAQILGFRLPQNFQFPYLSTHPSMFWERWHISLSSWLRDYLYIPLGGNRGTRARTLVNLMVTMLLGGLWHGAHVNMLIWGMGHGLLLVFYRLVEPLVPSLRRLPIHRLWATLLWFLLTTVLWVFFRASTTHDALILLEKMFLSWQIGFDPADLTNVDLWLVAGLVAAVALVHAVAVLAKGWVLRLRERLVVRALVWGVLAFGVLQWRADGLVPFVYFQF